MSNAELLREIYWRAASAKEKLDNAVQIRLQDVQEIRGELQRSLAAITELETRLRNHKTERGEM